MNVTIHSLPSGHLSIIVRPGDQVSDYLLHLARRDPRPPLRERLRLSVAEYNEPPLRKLLERSALNAVARRLVHNDLLPLGRTVLRWSLARDPANLLEPLGDHVDIRDLSLPVHLMPEPGTRGAKVQPTDWMILEAVLEVVPAPPLAKTAVPQSM